jgi:hypothetical protein
MLPLLCVFVLLVILLVSLDVSWLSLNIIVMALFGFIILFSSLLLYFLVFYFNRLGLSLA